MVAKNIFFKRGANSELEPVHEVTVNPGKAAVVRYTDLGIEPVFGQKEEKILIEVDVDDRFPQGDWTQYTRVSVLSSRNDKLNMVPVLDLESRSFESEGKIKSSPGLGAAVINLPVADPRPTGPYGQRMEGFIITSISNPPLDELLARLKDNNDDKV